MGRPLSDKQLALMDAYWRAANYLSVGQIYLYDNPLLKKLGKYTTGKVCLYIKKLADVDRSVLQELIADSFERAP